MFSVTKTQHYIGKILVIAMVFVLGVVVGYAVQKNVASDEPNVAAWGVDEEVVSILFDYSNDTVEVLEDIAITEGDTLAEVLRTLDADGQIDLGMKDYGGDLGIFIESINGVGAETDATRWWQYWVNNQFAKVGVSSHLVYPGDVIHFKFTTQQ